MLPCVIDASTFVSSPFVVSPSNHERDWRVPLWFDKLTTNGAHTANTVLNNHAHVDASRSQ